MFITKLFGKDLEVVDTNFENEIYYTSELEIPLAETDRIILKRQHGYN